MASFRYAYVVLTETGFACEGGFGQRDLSNFSNILASLHAYPDFARIDFGASGAVAGGDPVVVLIPQSSTLRPS